MTRRALGFRSVGIRNFLVEGVSGTGKTSVCDELTRRGFHAIHGDRQLAYQGDPLTGQPTAGVQHENHIWNENQVRSLAARRDEDVVFFCGGSRNFSRFLDVFDQIFVLRVDLDTLLNRLHMRELNDWGARPGERELVVSLHRSGEGTPEGGTVIDATPPVADVVDEILRLANVRKSEPRHSFPVRQII
ncbi:AAA family ATPase [Actinomycetes bacterium M1A6_2h]